MEEIAPNLHCDGCILQHALWYDSGDPGPLPDQARDCSILRVMLVKRVGAHLSGGFSE